MLKSIKLVAAWVCPVIGKQTINGLVLHCSSIHSRIVCTVTTSTETNMKFFILTVALLAVAQARPDSFDSNAEIRELKSDVKEDGTYEYRFQTTNGIAQQEQGVGGHYASGSSAYYNNNGDLIQLVYTADENGFHPQGAHLPTPPPIPAAILRSLEYIRTHPPKEQRLAKVHF
ncbi:pupal cuticle protein Edg-78E-like [Drosophila hydei]|uniref:Pupal cuticle protein Edg-78E-like n=1 Tax=Drosophila hydei TaxID=7224 RepID=A0A6J1LV78_DROHY|nr:pupal cuticle protein Edg-78E-like [Drosophila hydei]